MNTPGTLPSTGQHSASENSPCRGDTVTNTGRLCPLLFSCPLCGTSLHSCDSLPQNDSHAFRQYDWPRNLPATQDEAFYNHKNSHCPRWSAHSEVCDLASILICFPSLTASIPRPTLKRSSLCFCNTEMTLGQGYNGYIVSEFSTAHPDLFLPYSYLLG